VSQSLKTWNFWALNFEIWSRFFEIGELWSTYFAVVKKLFISATSPQNSVGQSSETKKLLNDQF